MAHLEDRVKQRTPFTPAVVPRLKKAITRGLTGKLPSGGAHHVKLPGGSYAVVKNVKGKPILATFLSGDMSPPGKDLTQQAGMDRLREAIKTAALSFEEVIAASEAKKPLSGEKAVGIVAKTQAKLPSPVKDPSAKLVSEGASGSKVANAFTAKLLRKAVPSDVYSQPSGEEVDPPMGVGDVLLAATGRHDDYDKFLSRADPRLVALLAKLKEGGF